MLNEFNTSYFIMKGYKDVSLSNLLKSIYLYLR